MHIVKPRQGSVPRQWRCSAIPSSAKRAGEINTDRYRPFGVEEVDRGGPDIEEGCFNIGKLSHGTCLYATRSRPVEKGVVCGTRAPGYSSPYL